MHSVRARRGGQDRIEEAPLTFLVRERAIVGEVEPLGERRVAGFLWGVVSFEAGPPGRKARRMKGEGGQSDGSCTKVRKGLAPLAGKTQQCTRGEAS